MLLFYKTNLYLDGSVRIDDMRFFAGEAGLAVVFDDGRQSWVVMGGQGNSYFRKLLKALDAPCES